MKVLLMSVALFIYSVSLQNKNVVNLIGTWKVTEVTVDKSSPLSNNPSMLSMMRTMMMRMSYTFNADHHVKITGASPGQEVPDGLWKYDPAKNKLEIKSAKDPDGRVLNMTVVKDSKRQVFFKLTDAPVTLRVVKQ